MGKRRGHGPVVLSSVGAEKAATAAPEDGGIPRLPGRHRGIGLSLSPALRGMAAQGFRSSFAPCSGAESLLWLVRERGRADYRAGCHQADQALALAKTQYEIGVITNLDLLVAQTSRYEANLQHIRALYEMILSRFTLRETIGGRIW